MTTLTARDGRTAPGREAGTVPSAEAEFGAEAWRGPGFHTDETPTRRGVA